ncbi:MAG: tellurium resistance protein TerC [Bacteroidales bacterium]|nr:tellurium resistance protein TerC [Bacteroidales bacterium]
MQKFLSTRRSVIIQTVSYLYILLFVYAAISKLLEFEDFRVQLAQSPMLSAYAGSITWVVPLIEIITAILLFFSKTKHWGFLCAFVIMVMFSAYIFIILNYSVFVPCSCGGIIEQLNWTEHLVFNLFFVLLAITGWLLTRPIKKLQGSVLKTTLILVSLGVVGVLTVTMLYLSSERIIYRENPFIRRYSHDVIKSGEIDLDGNAYYFAGDEAGIIYLGNYSSPLRVSLLDTALQNPVVRTIRVREADLPSKASQIRVNPPDFYLIDGQISRILKGNTADWKVTRRWDGNLRFSNYRLISDNKMAFRAFLPGTFRQALGYLQLADSLPYTLQPDLLEKQLDGNFDVDGILCYDSHSKQVVYTYYYHNAYLITDSVLNWLAAGNTIDTITRAQLVIDSSRLQRALVSSLMVNASAFATDGLLYVRSKIKGRYQPEKTWKQTGTIDVYDLSTGNYRTSFYVYHASGEPVRQFFVIGKSFYGFAGNILVRYNLERMLKSNE